MEDVEKVRATAATGKVCPIFSVSSCTGEGIDFLRSFLGTVPKPKAVTSSVAPELTAEEVTETEVTTKFIVDSRYFSKGIGLILGGTVLRGTVKIGQQMMFGPDRNGNFRPVTVKSIHENRVNIAEAGPMASVCLNIKTVGKNTEPIKNT
mmetsp:Transcript_33039/g.50631  ORF Transcript_33039/g.50631 Transcript_33039/m.50631 type:complete len:150 (+) Transcript_33039:715-1164(+)